MNQYCLRARYYDQSVGGFTQMGEEDNPITLNKYIYANADGVNFTDPTGNFGLGSFGVSFSIRSVLTTISVGSTTFDIFSSVTSGEDISPVQTGMFALASLGGFKLFKVFGKKFLKKYNCGKPNEHKICKIFQSDEERIKNIKKMLNIGKKKNVAFVDYITSSGVGSMIAESGENSRLGTVSMPAIRRYQTGFVSFPRKDDSEVKLYENMALKFTQSTKGIARLVSERAICRSCGRVGRLFKPDYPSLVVLTMGVFSY